MRKIVVILLLSFPLLTQGQEQEKKVKGEFLSLTNRVPINLAYYGNAGTHPGLKLGLDWNLLQVQRTKENKRRVKQLSKLLVVTPSVAVYSHKASHTGLVLNTDVVWRRYGKKLFRETSLGLGYFARFNAGETWVVGESGEVSSQNIAGRGYISPAFGYALGRRFQTKSDHPIEGYARFNINLLNNYNASVGMEISAEIGIRLTPSWSIKRTEVKTIEKSKKA